MHDYDERTMALGNSIDQGFRERLRVFLGRAAGSGTNQSDAARLIGRDQSWLNRYVNGSGNASIDDVLRLAALLIGIEAQPLSDAERRALRALRELTPDRQDDAVSVLETAAKSYLREQRRESSAPAARMPPATSRKSPGKR
jgi:transcriptional regulator with XRE-family HTH domain